MNRTLPILFLISLLFLASCAVRDDEEIPVPVAPPEPEAVVEQQVQTSPKPQVEEAAETPTAVSAFDPSRYNLEDIYFDFDKSNLRAEARSALMRYAQTLKANPDLKVLIEGHCDERGTEEYNLALGERRATRVRDYLVNLGVDTSRLKTISYGEMRPKAQGHDETAWSKNRRAHFNLSR